MLKIHIYSPFDVVENLPFLVNSLSLLTLINFSELQLLTLLPTDPAVSTVPICPIHYIESADGRLPPGEHAAEQGGTPSDGGPQTFFLDVWRRSRLLNAEILTPATSGHGWGDILCKLQTTIIVT